MRERQFAMFSRAVAHNSGANSTPVTFSKPYSPARMQARPSPQPKSTKCRAFDKSIFLRSLRKAQKLIGLYPVALPSFDRSNDVLDRTMLPLVLTP